MKKIIMHYLTKDFFLDILIAIGFLVSYSDRWFALNLLILVKWSYLFSLPEKLVDRWNLKEKQMAIYQLTKLMIVILYMIHMFGCLFLYIGRQELAQSRGRSWLREFNVSLSSQFEQY